MTDQTRPQDAPRTPGRDHEHDQAVGSGAVATVLERMLANPRRTRL